jgi:hypothetical protein
MDLVMITGLFPSKFDEDQNFGLSSWKNFVPLRQLPKKNFSVSGHDDLTLLAGWGKTVA